MGLTTDELQVLITANTKQFSDQLLKIQSSLNDLNKTTQTVGSTVSENMFPSLISANLATNLITGTISKLVNVTGQLSSNLFTNGSQLAVMEVTTNTVARNMGITADRVNELRKTLRDFNIDGMASEDIIKTLALSNLTDLGDSFKTVDARTGETITGTKALIVAMNDLSAAAGMNTSEGVSNIAKFIRMGRVQALDRVIDVSKLNSAEEAYAQKLGKTTAQLSDQEQQQFRLQVVMQESRKVLGDYANTSLSSAKAFEFVGTAIKNIFETLGSDLEPIFSVAGNAILAFFRGIQGTLDENENGIRDWAYRVAGIMVALVRIVGRLFSWLPIIGAGFQNLANFSLKPVAAQSALGASMNRTAGDAGQLTEATKGLNKELGKLASFDEMNVLDRGTGSVGNLGSGIGDLGGFGANPIENALDVGKINDYADKAMAIFNDLFSGFANWGANVINLFTDLWKGVQTIWNTFLSGLKPAWDMNGSNVIQGLLEFKDNTIAIFQSIYDNIVAPIVTPMLAALTQLWNEHFRQVTTSIANFILKLVDFTLTIYNRFISPVTLWLLNVLKPAFSVTGNFIGLVTYQIGGFIANMVTGIFNIMSDLITFLKGPFTVNWVQVWNVIGTIFANAWNGISYYAGAAWQGVFAGIRNGINWIIYQINSLIFRVNDAIGGLSGAIQSLPGGQPINFRIPYLAQGGVIESPTVAMLGESGKEVVMPLENNTQWIEQLADQINSKKSSSDTPQNLIIKIGEKTIYSGFIDYINEKTMAGNQAILKI